ncbi:hypothetical protein Scep_013845 [Stephania cephalantha]|uniref:Citrate synthase n=1 Tax=Stephania cephalantha TaxID=152367 RepID=A0AAP0J063_9MAGN
MEDLRSQLKELIPEQQERLKKLKAEHGKVQLGNITLDMSDFVPRIYKAIGGMRGVPGLLWETSLLDPDEDLLLFFGNSFLGVSPSPNAESIASPLFLGGEPLLKAFCGFFLDRQNHVYKAIDALPLTAHPMTQFASGVMALQVQSEFQKAYEKGISKAKYWEPTYEDSLNLIAQVPVVASYVYRRIYKGGKAIPADNSLDYGANFSHMLGFDDPKMQELMRLYVTIHSDHEGGNVSAHTGHLVASALSDPYLSFAAALNGLAGPLHGLANQEVLLWIKALVDEHGENVTTEELKDYVWKKLNSGKREFALKHLPDDPLFQLVSKLFEVVPQILTQLGKVKNPWPNVDAHSGVLLHHFGLTEAKYYTVLFGVSRSLGICSQLIWDRALGLPLERPKSVTMEWLEAFCKKAA